MTGLERLEVLADFLESDAVPDERFDMRTWVHHDSPWCGTASCAAGWACMNPTLVAEGLHLDGNTFRGPTFGGHVDFDALMEFFELEDDEVFELFDIDGHDDRAPISKAAVAARIREFIASKEGQAAHG